MVRGVGRGEGRTAGAARLRHGCPALPTRHCLSRSHRLSSSGSPGRPARRGHPPHLEAASGRVPRCDSLPHTHTHTHARAWAAGGRAAGARRRRGRARTAEIEHLEAGVDAKGLRECGRAVVADLVACHTRTHTHTLTHSRRPRAAARATHPHTW